MIPDGFHCAAAHNQLLPTAHYHSGLHLQLLQGETPAQALLGIVLDGLATDHWLQGASSWPGESGLGLLSAGCRIKTAQSRGELK